jgi:hypothetical protein
MDHYKQAERLLDSGLLTAAIGHAILALVDVLRDDEPGEWPAFLRPIADVEVRDGLL